MDCARRGCKQIVICCRVMEIGKGKREQGRKGGREEGREDGGVVGSHLRVEIKSQRFPLMHRRKHKSHLMKRGAGEVRIARSRVSLQAPDSAAKLREKRQKSRDGTEVLCGCQTRSTCRLREAPRRFPPSPTRQHVCLCFGVLRVPPYCGLSRAHQ